MPVYFGNGQPLMDEIGLNRRTLVDRAAFGNDAAFVDEVVRLAQHPDELDAMRALRVLQSGRALDDFHALAPFAAALQPDARVYIDNPRIPLWERIIRMLGATGFSVVHSEADADVMVHSCCGWDRGRT